MPGVADVYFQLIGPMLVSNRSGVSLTPSSRKAKAILATLCVVPHGRRGRKWLQSLLWSDRGDKQGADSLRQCLHEIRASFGEYRDVLFSDLETVALDLGRVQIDVHSMGPKEWSGAANAQQEFLEGIDVRDPEFDDWLREQRAIWLEQMTSKASQPVVPRFRQDKTNIEAPRAETALTVAQNWSLAIAVLPMTNLSAEPKLNYACEGLSEDLIDRLQRIRWLPVIARSSSFSGNGAWRRHTQAEESNSADGTDGTNFARDLGALYVISGAVYDAPLGHMVRMRLSETERSHILWSDSLDLPSMMAGEGFEDVFNDIVGSIERAITLNHQQRVITSPANGQDYQDHIWRGRWHLSRLTSNDAEKSLQHFKAAHSLKPEASEAIIQLSFWHLWHAWVKGADSNAIEVAERFARRAAQADPDDGRCYALMGISHSWRRNYQTAIGSLQQALELTPSLSIAHHQLGSTFCLDERPEDAIGPILTAIRYSPRDQLDFTYQTELAVAYVRLEHFAEGWAHASRAIEHKPHYWYAHLVRMLAATRLGDKALFDEAHSVFRQTGMRITSNTLSWLPFRTNVWRKELEDFIKKINL